MNILVDIGHPAHVHLFKNFINIMLSKGFNVFVTTRKIDSITKLLDNYNIKYSLLGKKYDSRIGKALNMLKFDLSLLRIVKKNNIQIAVGTSINICQVSKFTNLVSFFFEDDDSAVVPLSKKYAHPYANYIVSPDVLNFERNKSNHITYPGYHELAYLHPNRFKPDPKIIEDAGIKRGEEYFILRFNAFKAHHDVGAKGLSNEDKRKLISLLSKYGKVYISSEREIEEEFKQYQLKVPSQNIHSFIYYAKMLIGDSQTMTSEAAVLGTPAIRCNSFVGRISLLEEEEHKYGLTFGFLPTDTDKMFEKIEYLLKIPNLKEEWQNRRNKLLHDKIDVTAFIVWLIENHPESTRIIKEEPKFKYSTVTN